MVTATFFVGGPGKAGKDGEAGARELRLRRLLHLFSGQLRKLSIGAV